MFSMLIIMKHCILHKNFTSKIFIEHDIVVQISFTKIQSIINSCRLDSGLKKLFQLLWSTFFYFFYLNLGKNSQKLLAYIFHNVLLLWEVPIWTFVHIHSSAGLSIWTRRADTLENFSLCPQFSPKGL